MRWLVYFSQVRVQFLRSFFNYVTWCFFLQFRLSIYFIAYLSAFFSVWDPFLFGCGSCVELSALVIIPPEQTLQDE